jgi:hypothetical protein
MPYSLGAAVHESGHAVVGAALGMRIYSAHLNPMTSVRNGSPGGHVWRMHDDDYLALVPRERGCRNVVCMLTAGIMAQACVCLLPSHEEFFRSKLDQSRAVDVLMDELGLRGEAVNRAYRKEEDRALAILDKNREALDALWLELYRRGDMDEPQLRPFLDAVQREDNDEALVC